MTALSEISKRGPRLTPEQKAEQKRQRTQARVGLGSNVLGLTAGAAATGAALRDERFAGGGKIARGLYKVGSKIPKPIQRLNDKLGMKGKAALAGGALALQAGNMGGDVVANRVLSRSAKKPEPKGKVKKGMYDESITGVFISKSDHTTGHGSIDKAYRRYDPEADRQRRLGLAAGAGTGGAIVLGSQAARQFTTHVDDKKIRGIAVKPKAGKKAILLTGGTVLTGGLGAAAYRRGLSERNNPWN